ncbi:MAG: DUF2283 domain-containing protein [Leptospiraceae bacterium]|nr:DUF2283 domain-containing protein [Leptospiraceae bacterium]
MQLKYDKEVDAIHIIFKRTTVTTKQLSEDLAVDYDAAGKIVGIEILDASENFDSRNLQSIVKNKILSKSTIPVSRKKRI